MSDQSQDHQIQNAEGAESAPSNAETEQADQTLEQLAGAASAVSPPASAGPGDPGDADPGDADAGDADAGDAQTPGRCEGCEQPATTHDLDGVALCEECAAALLAEALAPAEAPDLLAAARARGAPAKWTQEYVHSLPAPAELTVEECSAELEAIGDIDAALNAARDDMQRATQRRRETLRELDLADGAANTAYRRALADRQWSSERQRLLRIRVAATS